MSETCEGRAIEFRGNGTYWDQAGRKFISQAEAYARTGIGNVSGVYLLPSSPEGCLTEVSWDVVADPGQSLAAVDRAPTVLRSLLHDFAPLKSQPFQKSLSTMQEVNEWIESIREDLKCAESPAFEIGDLVWIEDPHQSNVRCRAIILGCSYVYDEGAEPDENGLIYRDWEYSLQPISLDKNGKKQDEIFLHERDMDLSEKANF